MHGGEYFWVDQLSPKAETIDFNLWNNWFQRVEQFGLKVGTIDFLCLEQLIWQWNK
jgi:hypothetical protein